MFLMFTMMGIDYVFMATVSNRRKACCNGEHYQSGIAFTPFRVYSEFVETIDLELDSAFSHITSCKLTYTDPCTLVGSVSHNAFVRFSTRSICQSNSPLAAYPRSKVHD